MSGMWTLQDRDISEAVRLLREAAHPEKIILFGSRARGDNSPRSDVDLLVILPEVTNRHAEIRRLYQVVAPLGLPVDILVYSQHDVAERGHIWGTALHEALKEGVVLYGDSRGSPLLHPAQ